MKVALYARVSTKGQTNDNQTDKLTQFAAARGYEVYSMYCDKVSGQNKNRPELDRMTKDAKFRKFELIIATKIDRIGRSIIHLCEFFDEMESYGIDIETTDQPINTSTPMGKFTRNILASVAEFERELISERTKDGLKRTVSDGTKLGRTVKTLSPYQIEKAKRIITENPTISNRALASQFEGISRNTLISILKELGVIE